MTKTENFNNFAAIIESNTRYMELSDKLDNQTITPEEFDELNELFDETFFSPFLFRDFLLAEDDDDPEEDARIKAEVQSMIDRGIIGIRHS